MIAKHEDNPKEALIQVAMAGGDPPAREMIVGIVLGAHIWVRTTFSENGFQV